MTTQGRVIPLLGRAESRGSLEKLDDPQLLAVCASGDRGALSVFFKRFAGDVTRFLSRMIGPADAELDDLVQSTFLAAARSAVRFAGGSTVRTWLLGVAANQAKLYLRARRRGREAMARLAEIPSAVPTLPDRLAEQRQLLGRLGSALAKLDVDRRVAFLLCEVEGIPGPQAAELLQIPQGTLWRRLSEARSRLRDALDGGAR